MKASCDFPSLAKIGISKDAVRINASKMIEYPSGVSFRLWSGGFCIAPIVRKVQNTSEVFAVWDTKCLVRMTNILFGPSCVRPICRLH